MLELDHIAIILLGVIVFAALSRWLEASILFALLILERFAIPEAEEILACVVLTVMLSIVLHGISANPMASRFVV